MIDRVTMSAVEPSPALHVLLRAVVDYAGLFPPASLDMPAAVAEYARHREGPHAWALSRFVLPAARLDELDGAAAAFLPREGARSWALSALVASDIEDDVERIEQFNARHRDARQGAVLVDTVELKARSARDVERAGELLDRRFDTYLEVPVADDPADLIAAIARTRAKAKIRMGGVTADAFPTGTQIIRFIGRCIADGVSFKATAGLHHAWRSEYRLTYASDAPVGAMFGFMNVLLATAALHAGFPEGDAARLLDERDGSAVSFVDRGGALWRDHTISLHALGRARDSMTAFGSCSFREPVSDLQALGLL